MDKEVIAFIGGVALFLTIVFSACIFEKVILVSAYKECVSTVASKPAVEINLVCGKIMGKN